MSRGFFVRVCMFTVSNALLMSSATAMVRAGGILWLNPDDCGHSLHHTHHLFVYPSKQTTLSLEWLWTAPTEAVKHLYLAFNETS